MCVCPPYLFTHTQTDATFTLLAAVRFCLCLQSGSVLPPLPLFSISSSLFPPPLSSLSQTHTHVRLTPPDEPLGRPFSSPCFRACRSRPRAEPAASRRIAPQRKCRRREEMKKIKSQMMSRLVDKAEEACGWQRPWTQAPPGPCSAPAVFFKSPRASGSHQCSCALAERGKRSRVGRGRVAEGHGS